MKGGKTRIAIVNIMNDITTRTISNEINLGIFKPVLI